MSHPIHEKLVIAVASSALFDLTESHAVFTSQGQEAYRQYQEANLDQILPRGTAFPFIRRFLHINRQFPEIQPVEVVLLSRNSFETGLRVFRSIQHYQLDITRAAFTSGTAPYKYIPAFNVSLFLSANPQDVSQAIESGFPAGLVISPPSLDDDHDHQLRIAFDFDGVLADDEAETVYKTGNLAQFTAHEQEKMRVPHQPGPLARLLQNLAYLQKLETPTSEQILRIAIITARNAPSHERVITTLKHWQVGVDETFFLGGMAKHRILEILKPHIFFDDQISHLHTEINGVSLVHIPFGVANQAF